MSNNHLFFPELIIPSFDNIYSRAIGILKNDYVSENLWKKVFQPSSALCIFFPS